MLRHFSKQPVLLTYLLAVAVGGCAESSNLPPAQRATTSAAETVADGPEKAYCMTAATNISYNRELVITDFNVLNDPCRTTWDSGKCTDPTSSGTWTFAHIVRQAAGGSTVKPLAVSQFVLRLFNSYKDAPIVNGQPLPVRGGVLDKLIKTWRAASPGCSADPDDLNCTLDLTKAPLRLLAIVNRMDLRTPLEDSYASGVGGQARMIYGGLDPAGKPMGLSLIAEYSLPAQSDSDVLAWAKSWHELASYTPGTGDYNDRLQHITDGFVASDAMPSSERNNGSALSALRSSELAFGTGASPSQEFREFSLGCLHGDNSCKLTGRGMQLLPKVTAQTPSSDYASDAGLKAMLTTALNAMEAEVLNEEQEIPNSFLSGAADIKPLAASFRWPVGPSNPLVRRLFAISTCTGCHFRETMDGSPAMLTGYHINPLNGQLSHFLSQPIKVQDVDGSVIAYDEKLRRQCEFRYLLDGNISKTLTTPSGRDHK